MIWTRQFLGWLIGLSVVAVVIGVTIHGGDETSGVDKYSYEKGYETFPGLTESGGSRGDWEDACHALYREEGLAAPDWKLVEKDWVRGCADAAQNKKSIFSSN